MRQGETVLAQARQLIQINRPDDAITLLNGYLAESPQDAVALSLLAFANLRSNRAQEALHASEQALGAQPDHAAAWQHHSMALRQLDRHDEALASAEEFVRLAPTLWASHYTLGLVLRGLPGRRASALTAASRSVELAPDLADPYVLLGLVYSDRQDYQNAARFYERALAIDPGHAFAISNLSGLELRKGRFNKAMRGFRTAAQASPQEEMFHRNMVATVFSSLIKYGLMIAVLTVFAALLAAGVATPGHEWWPRLVVLGVVVLAWTALLGVKLLPLSRHLRGKLYQALRDALRTRPFQLLVGGFTINQACALAILLVPSLSSPELLTTLANVVLLVAMGVGRRLRTRES